MPGKTTGPGPRTDRPTHRVAPKNHDTYRDGAKPKQPFMCAECGVVWQGKHWAWSPPPEGRVDLGKCPACRRIHDHYPAGMIRLHPVYDAYRDEIRGMISNVEAAEREEHPLERVIEVRDTPRGIRVTTTGLHIARRVAGKLSRRFHRRPAVRYPPEENRVYLDIDP